MDTHPKNEIPAPAHRPSPQSSSAPRPTTSSQRRNGFLWAHNILLFLLVCGTYLCFNKLKHLEWRLYDQNDNLRKLIDRQMPRADLDRSEESRDSETDSLVRSFANREYVMPVKIVDDDIALRKAPSPDRDGLDEIRKAVAQMNRQPVTISNVEELSLAIALNLRRVLPQGGEEVEALRIDNPEDFKATISAAVVDALIHAKHLGL